jgi:hypothetical protein
MEAELNPQRHRRLIERIVQHYVRAEVHFVPDVAAWISASSGSYSSAEYGNPIGMALWNSTAENPNRILLRTPLSSQAIQEHLLALYLSGFRRVYFSIESNFAFLKHLVLHEVAHIRHNWNQDREKDCDRWAFKELPRWA